MKTQREKMLWRGAVRKNYKLAEKLYVAAEEIKSANKPSDLTYPQWFLIDLSIQIRERKYEWLEKTMNLDPANRGQWPYL